MKTRDRFKSILAALMAMSLAIPGGAWAGGGHYDNGGHAYGHQHKGRSGGHYNNHNTYNYSNYYGRGHYKGGGNYYPYKYGYSNYCAKKQHHHNNNNNNDKLWIGLLGGGIVGYTLSNVHWGY